ncbi:acyl carrier protein [Micromonospora sp. WMMA1949]|uniref:acyl carrier protein n=1 Tax=unclassified Micromonospora TaxID=2617518 RepID=UPI0022B60102|nr:MULTISPECIES: acyl carrier protein [unclassified Micromonospora]MCZ7428734.1 acyl carrier protein [Micromonospora sp. WMMA1949]WBC12281.1 acyl carrier protein [Micromonospora sp. WMMA1947]
MTLPDLEEIMRRCAGDDESTSSFQQAPDQAFTDLGYDSLALLETQSVIKRDYGVEISEQALSEATTPRQLVDLVNRWLTAA